MLGVRFVICTRCTDTVAVFVEIKEALMWGSIKVYLTHGWEFEKVAIYYDKKTPYSYGYIYFNNLSKTHLRILIFLKNHIRELSNEIFISYIISPLKSKI